MMGPTWPLEHPILWIVGAIVVVIPMWRICDRMGHPGWFSIAALIPLLNVVLLYYLGFADWPRDRPTPGGATSEP